MFDFFRAKHQVPVFRGRQSRHHRRRLVSRLWLEAWIRRLRCGHRLDEAETFVQFVGFPRSGHSLIGSILDAHPHALISHELDAMGLFRHGLSEEAVFALIAGNTEAFERNGRWWNGYSYAIEGGYGGRADPVKVIGDKKGDWAVRWFLKDPALLGKVARLTARRRRKWILVLRNPFDNIATMSLRKGRTYDRLRIEAQSTSEFRKELAAEKGRGIPAEALDEMIADYASLCQGVAAMKAQIAPEDWLEVRHESLVAAPEAEIGSLFRFVGLPADEDHVRRAAKSVRPSTHQSRQEVAWTDAKRSTVTALIARHDFLKGYHFEG
jgi:hypothetical protein